MLLCGLLLVCVSMTALGQTAGSPLPGKDATPLIYELVSIHRSKPDAQGYDLNNTSDGMTARAINLRQLLSEGYGFTFGDMLRDQIVGVPGWAETQRFDIQAKVDDSQVERLKAARKGETMSLQLKAMAERKPTTETAMLQELIEEYFHLKMHYEQRAMPVFAMTVAKGGVKMKAAQPQDLEHGSLNSSNGKMAGKNVPLDFMTFLLAREVGRTVVNRTNLPGRFDFEMAYTPGAGMNSSASNESAPSIFTALEEQLGIKLVSAKEPVWMIVIDHVEMPADE